MSADLRDLKELRQQWEHGLTVVCERGPEEPDADTCWVVLHKAATHYKCHRYFTVGNKWLISVDRPIASADEAIQWAMKVGG